MKIVRFLALSLLIAAAAAPVWAVEPLSRCQELEKWAAQLEKLPTDFESFIAFEPDQRRAVYVRLSNAQRAALWQAQLTSALKEKS